VISKAASTNATDPECVVYYMEYSTPQGNRVQIPDFERSLISGTGDNTVLTGPSTSTVARRVADKLWLYNKDSITHTFIVKHRSSGTNRSIKRIKLDPEESAEYTSDGGGW
jgi:hypothetical protein